VFRGKPLRRRYGLNRYEVGVLFRVLPDSDVASILVTRARYSLGARESTRLSRYSVICPRSSKRLPKLSSREVRLSFTVCPENLAISLSTDNDSPGILCPFNA
jgi:hypothetical protein